MHKFSIKEARFVFQEAKEEPAKVEGAKVEVKPGTVVGFRNPDGSYYADGKYYGLKDGQVSKDGVPMSIEDAAVFKVDGYVPIMAEVSAVAPGKAAAIEVVAQGSTEKRGEVKEVVREGVKVESGFKLDKFKEALVGGKFLSVMSLLKLEGKTVPRSVTLDYLKDADYSRIVAQVSDFYLSTVKDKDVPPEVLEVTGGTKEDFWKAAVPEQVKAGFVAHMKFRLNTDLEYLVKFVNSPETKFTEFSYFVEYGTHGPRLDLGPQEFMNEYKAFAAKQDKLPPPPAAEVAKAAADRLEAKNNLKKIPILKWIAGLFSLNDKEKDANGNVIPNGRDGWDMILDGDHTLALAALDFFGYGDEVAQCKGQFEGMLGFVPEGAQASIKNLRKSVNQPTNPLSAAAYRAKLAEKTGKPQETTPGKPAIVAHENVKGTVLAEIAESKDKKVPRKGVRLIGPATMDMFNAKLIKIDLKAGNLTVPEKSDIIVNGKRIPVPKGETKTFTKTDGKDGVIELNGTLLAGTVIDANVKIEKAS